MKIAINQPAYLPWPGYLDRIANADLFVVMDDTQFERGSLVNRNKIRDQHGWRWLMVLAICKHFGADQYVSGRGGRDYLDVEKMEGAGVAVSWDSWQPTPYPQVHGDFIPGLSILDMWMNTEHNPWESQSSSLLHTLMTKRSVAEEPLGRTSPEEIKSTS